jgi:hypothetical protein
MAFSRRLTALKRTAPAFVPWAWGLNGMASVVAPVLSVAVSVTFGMGILLLSVIPVYLAAGFAAPRDTGQHASLTRPRRLNEDSVPEGEGGA